MHEAKNKKLFPHFLLSSPSGVRGGTDGSILAGSRLASTVKRHLFQKEKLLSLKVI